MEGTDFKEFQDKLLRDPAIRKEYEALKPKYTLIEQSIKDEQGIE